MVDPIVRHMLEQTVDSPVKLQLLLMFCEHPRTEGTARQIAGRIFRDMWSTHEALHGLAEAGLLDTTVIGGETLYHYRPLPRFQEPIARLMRQYNEPLVRDDIQRIVRDAAQNTSYFSNGRALLELSI